MSATPALEKLPRLPSSSLRALDWLNFFVAQLQTGFGPFIAVYLTESQWTQADIGFVLSIGSLTALVLQIPGGAMVDAAHSKTGVAALGIVGIGVSALLFVFWPSFGPIALAEILHGAASAVLGPAIIAISLALVGHRAAGARFGRNARFASLGNGVAAGLLAGWGYFLSNTAVFAFTAALTLPTLLSLYHIRDHDIDAVLAWGDRETARGRVPIRSLLRNRGLVIFALCAMLYQLADTAMLPLIGGIVTERAERWAAVLIALCIIVPQIIVVLVAPWLGGEAENWGRKPLLLIGFATLPLRGVLFAFARDPYALVAIQAIDGIAAAVFGVLVALVVADLTRGTGRFNLAQGILGAASGIGASLSTALAGLIVDHFGDTAGFLALAGAGLAGLVLLALAMPETRWSEVPSRRPSLRRR